MKSLIKFLCETQKDDWTHFLWQVEINGEFFEYRTGLGHSTNKYKKDGFSFNKKPENAILYENKYIHKPTINKVLEALFSDSSFTEGTFLDFCDDLGYSSDSIKALDMYLKICENDKKLRKCLGKDYYSLKDKYLNQSEG